MYHPQYKNVLGKLNYIVELFSKNTNPFISKYINQVTCVK